MKKGTYENRRRDRKIKRFKSVLKLKAKNLFIEIVSFIIGLIFVTADRLFRKKLRIVKRGEIYEGIKN